MGQDHRTKQSLLCLGCQSKYANAGELIGHLEKGMCRNESRPQEAISKLKFQDHINQKTIIEHMLNEGMFFTQRSLLNAISSSTSNTP